MCTVAVKKQKTQHAFCGERNPRFNNADYISTNPVLSTVKVMYYCAFALLYGLAGSCSDVIMVNSTWTLGHIPALWRLPSCTGMVYLPCDVRFFIDMPLEDEVS
ncbi:GDP-Man:Man(3)GlcNAc(2)-PP-Dol alpha-1,2-mannosyltransferase-like [Salvelinus sp. IW2-2015]|uniref:GDP-Man:Man(3)GlcNAc(2)-PP-Dol alpha-1,2-mannosyltransferase-like n=1 Tax=Salvelinus sp. IW2-2015 TaxID=2691554 RepID=UPI0038D451E6